MSLRISNNQSLNLSVIGYVYMKDSYQIINDNIELIIKLIDKNNYNYAANICSDIITTFTIMDYDDGIFIFEILEGIFAQVNNVFTSFDINDNTKKELSTRIKEQLIMLLSAYKNDNKEHLYTILKTLRSDATIFQLRGWINSNPKSTRRAILREPILREDIL